MPEPFLVEPTRFHLFIQSNSPGELAAWVLPFAKIFKKNRPDSKIIIFLAPCQYATGQEKRVALQSPDIDAVWIPSETIKFLLSRPIRPPFSAPGAVLYLGGDPMYSQLLGFKLRLPAYVYTERSHFSGLGIRNVFFKHKIGDLMATRISNRSFNRTEILQKYQLPDTRYALFFPGSRKQHLIYFLPFIIDTFRALKIKQPNFQAILQISPFISEVDLAYIHTLCRPVPELHLVQGDSVELMAISDLLMCLPGTSTAEAMYMRLPMLMVLPLNNPKVIVFDGLLGLIGNVPGLGLLIKKLIILYLKTQHRLYALPNLMAKRKVVPELIGVLTPEATATAILDLWNAPNKLQKMRSELSQFPIYSDTAQKIYEEIIAR